jgi:hypothetical protein
MLFRNVGTLVTTPRERTKNNHNSNNIHVRSCTPFSSVRHRATRMAVCVNFLYFNGGLLPSEYVR